MENTIVRVMDLLHEPSSPEAGCRLTRIEPFQRDQSNLPQRFDVSAKRLGEQPTARVNAVLKALAD